jgi:CBS domain-containing protein
MAILDRAKAIGERARVQAKRGLQLGRARRDEVQARRERRRLLQRLGEACYAERSGEATHEAVVRAFAALDAHQQPQAAMPAPSTTPATGPQMARRAREIMHPGAECISAEESVATAAQKMRDLGVGSLPICGADDRLHGILTDRDIVLKCIAASLDPAQVRAGDLGQDTLFWVDAGADVGEVLQQMEDHRIKRLPVIENHRLVGMITEADLARTIDEHRLAEFVEKVYATT